MSDSSENLPAKPNIGIIDWLVALPFHCIFLPQFIIWDILQRLAYYVNKSSFYAVSNTLMASYLQTLKLVGTKFEIEGSENIPKDKPLIVVSNHQSLFDIPILSVLFASKRPRFVAKQELAKWIPTASFNLRKHGHAVIDRKNSKQALSEISRVAELISAENSAIIIFPEGTRARDGMLKKFRPNGLKTLLEKIPDAHVIPVVIDGSWKLSLHKCMPIPAGIKVNVRVLNSKAISEITSKEAYAEDIRSQIVKTLNNMRA